MLNITRRKVRPVAAAIFLFLAFLGLGNDAEAVCKNSIFNPISDVCWDCMFPVRIGGNSFGTSSEIAPGETDSPVCTCANSGGVTVGISTAFWEHSRLIETVKDAYCFSTLGTSMADNNSLDGLLSGSQRSEEASDQTDYASQQVHYYIFPVWQILNLFTDFPCAEKRPFDIASITEVDPTWNDDLLAFVLNPEAMLFANPVTQVSCAADSVAANIGRPLDPLFWCLGSWGSTYPLSGSTVLPATLTYNAQLASRMIFKMGREGLLWDTAINHCATDGVPSPIMVKSHYRLQLAKPVRGNSCVPIGRSSLIWGGGKNPPMGSTSNAPDNFMWVALRARTCCVGYTVK